MVLSDLLGLLQELLLALAEQSIMQPKQLSAPDGQLIPDLAIL